MAQLKLWLERAQLPSAPSAFCFSPPDTRAGDGPLCPLMGRVLQMGFLTLSLSCQRAALSLWQETQPHGWGLPVMLFLGPSGPMDTVSRDCSAEMGTKADFKKMGWGARNPTVWLFQEGWFLFKLWFYICFGIWIWRKAKKEGALQL